MNNLAIRAIGVLLLLVGIVLFILPIPVGWLVIGIGIAFVCGHDIKSLRQSIESRRSKNRWLDKTCNFFSSVCPNFMKRWLNQLSTDSGA